MALPDLEAGAARLNQLLHTLGISRRTNDHGIAAQDWQALINAA